MKAKFAHVYWLFMLLPFAFTFRAAAAPLSTMESGPKAISVPMVTLRAASGATIHFETQNGRTIEGVPPATRELPYLVLLRNGALSGAAERTLVLEVSGIDVPPGGATITLTVETQAIAPGVEDSAGQRIPVWRETRRISSSTGFTQTNVTVAFGHRFTETVTLDGDPITSPTGYYRYAVAVTDADRPQIDPRYRFGAEYAFLMENQWIARLPEVLEESAGAAPDELVVYYCDMFPFRKSTYDPATWLPREKVTAYVGTELVPQLVEAFRIQSNEWRFPWYEAWTSYRAEDAERLSVTLTDRQTWFHGAAPSGGHSGISIAVRGGRNAFFATLTEGIVSTFYHELFHNLQRNISLHSGGDGAVGGAGAAWDFFSEGTAMLAESVGQPHGHFTQTLPAGIYMSYANDFVWRGSGRAQGLNLRYDEMESYQAAVYWRFLYEQCADRDLAVGMRIIERALTTLYSGEVVDIRSSTALIGAIPEVMDQALAGSSCPFQNYQESLTAFARALYKLRLAGGRCVEADTPTGCGFYDPYNQYHDPPVRTIRYAGTGQEVREGIWSSFGIDLIEVQLDPAANGQPLTLEFYGDPLSDAEFNVQLWLLADSGEDTKPRLVPTEMAAVEVHKPVSPDGRFFYVFPAIRTNVYNRLGLIVTRLDAQQASDPIGEYTIVLHPGVRTDAVGVPGVAYGK